jgi:hypothetical protein
MVPRVADSLAEREQGVSHAEPVTEPPCQCHGLLKGRN